MDYQLQLTPDANGPTVELRLVDRHGAQLGFNTFDLGKLTTSQWRALFNLRSYLSYYLPPEEHAAELAKLGVVIAEELLGAESFKALWRPTHQRTLQVQLPAAGGELDGVVALLARVPWELARPSAEQPPLSERHLLVQVVHAGPAPLGEPLALAPEGPLKVLLVFAEAPGSPPLAMRLEREALLALFQQEIYPQRRVVVDVLVHGVTRERVQAQFEEAGGYHILHWSGHGHLDLLELAGADGRSDQLSGTALLELCNGRLPRLAVLSACHSGEVAVGDWRQFEAAVAGQPVREVARDIDMTEAPPGFTGTAHGLLGGGVPSVVAMRYAVGDDYARLLATEFYRALLAHPQPKTVAEALTSARAVLRGLPEQHRFHPVDAWTPVLYGAVAPGVTPPKGRSEAADVYHRRLPEIPELHPHPHFVGRGGPLAQLGAGFIGAARGAAPAPVAQLVGLGGMGKTALAAEVLGLWEGRFNWVLLFQSKPNPISFNDWLRQLHLRLIGEQGVYHDRVTRRPAEAIYREPDAQFTGEARFERLTDNLILALRNEALLLVLDNFESQLKPHGGSDGFACTEPAWERCLTRLAHELKGSGSRVLITSRQPLSALAEGGLTVALGPLPAAEAALFVRQQPVLAEMFFSALEEERELAQRLLTASRFHPLLLDRLARLAAGGKKLRATLIEAIEALERKEATTTLPGLFTGAGGAAERAYLEAALAGSIDQLLAVVGLEGRRLLWVVAVANEAVEEWLLQWVWSGEAFEQQQLRELQQLLGRLEELPLELQEELKALPPELRAELDALPPPAPRPDLAPLLKQLLAVGLVTAEGGDVDNPLLSCHELVRERVGAWMAAHPQEIADLEENRLRLAYAERLVAAFKSLLHQDMGAALVAGSRALVYCVQAGAWARLGAFAGRLVTATADPRLLQALLPHLRAAAEAAPEGRERWRCLTYLADGLRQSDQPDIALDYYAQAAALAQAATAAGGEVERQAWADLATINGNWANALSDVGDLEGARRRQLESAESERKAGSPAVDILGSELEALRIDIMQGQVAQALPEVEQRLDQLTGWWQRREAGERVAEAPDREVLARALFAALDIARQAHFAEEAWEAALGRLDATLELKQALGRPAQDIAATRTNRANVLARLGRLPEAQGEMEACLGLFQGDAVGTSAVLSSLADVFDEQGDVAQAIAQARRALALHNQLPDPQGRATSHGSLANYLERRASAADRAESPRHQLAALIYRLVADLRQHLQTSLRNYAVRFQRAHQDGTPLPIPRLSELLADPAFEPLARWLGQRGVALEALQAEIDEGLEQVRQAAVTPTEGPTAPEP